MPLILAIETSGSVSSIALQQDDTLLEALTLPEGLHLEAHLLSGLQRMFAARQLRPEAPELLAVSTGPGSYTGLRIGITCAKMISLSLAIPVVAVSSLMAMAVNQAGPVVCAALDARRGNVFAGVYAFKDTEHLPDVLVGPHLTTPARIAGILQEETLLLGDAAEQVAQHAGIRHRLARHDGVVPKAQSVAWIGRRLFETGEVLSAHALRPCYMQQPHLQTPRKHHASA